MHISILRKQTSCRLSRSDLTSYQIFTLSIQNRFWILLTLPLCCQTALCSRKVVGTQQNWMNVWWGKTKTRGDSKDTWLITSHRIDLLFELFLCINLSTLNEESIRNSHAAENWHCANLFHKLMVGIWASATGLFINATQEMFLWSDDMWITSFKMELR